LVFFRPQTRFRFFTFCFAEFKLVPEGGLNPPKEIFLADSAYNRADIGAGIQVRTPVPLPEDGSAPKVRDFFLFLFF